MKFPVKIKIKKLAVSKKQASVAIGLIVLLGLGFLFKNWFIVAIVNNQPISRFSLDRELEKQDGKQVLESKITEMLVLGEAKKQKININQAEIDEKVNQIKAQLETQGQQLDAALAAQGQTQKDLENQIRLQLSAEKLLGTEIQVSDQEISDYFKKNQSSYPKGTKLEEKSAEIKDQLTQQKMSEKVPAWLENLRKQAKIYYFLQL